jgi:hypothetical protein
MKAGGHRTEDGLLEIRTIKSSVNYTSSGEFRTLFKAQRSSYLEHDYEKLCRLIIRKFESIDFYVQISGGDLPDFEMGDDDNYITLPAGLVYFFFKPSEKYTGSRISKEDHPDKDRKQRIRKGDRSLIPSRNFKYEGITLPLHMDLTL